jgi:NADH:ubiquinone oxidoreductase subunit F (NADH-binding)
VAVATRLTVRPGPALLAGIEEGPGLAAHRARYGGLPPVSATRLLALVEGCRLRGRGGAAFPFATKLATVARGRRPVVVVNLCEGEPASSKDAALALRRPHLVLDGAVGAAVALGAREVHVAVTVERREIHDAVVRALAERDDPVRVRVHRTTGGFVSGQASAVVELVSGRENVPVTTWAPAAISGVRGRPTLLSNAETWAHVGRLLLLGERATAGLGTPDEPGTTLLTWSESGQGAEVVEVPFGSRLRDVLPPSAWRRPALVGGFHGTWAAWPTLASARVSVPGMRALGLALGAGVVLSSPGCPVELSSQILRYLAVQSAGRCGPCVNGLPALAAAWDDVLGGRGDLDRVRQLAGLVAGRGACAHPDGTARLARSCLEVLGDEVARHADGDCGWGDAEHPGGVAS